MLVWIDLNETAENPFAANYDVCVCGSGPAGMAVVQYLMAQDLKVLLLEAGGLEPSVESQNIYQAKSIGALTYYGVDTCRLRYFGGTSNHWAGRCGTLEPIDFEQRDIWNLPGWPISREETYKHLDDALQFLDLKPGAVDRRQEPDWKSDRFIPSGFAWSAPTRVGTKYKSSLEDASNVDVALNANVTDITLNDAGTQAEALTVTSYAGSEFAVKADYFVLAFGALENARFLLNANVQNSKGIGNQNDMVGRCFMEHFSSVLGRFVPTETGKSFWSRSENLSLNPAAEISKKERLGTAVVSMTPNGKPSFYGRLAPFRKFNRNLVCSNDFLLDRARATKDISCVGDGVVGTIMEQVPNTSSRITLDQSEKDQFGNARFNLEWKITDQDRATIKGTAIELGKAMAANGLGRFRVAPDVLDGTADVGFHCHQMGTTRMSADPRHGVVDGDSRVHGLNNLYIGGSSVFPTGGGVNPTTTIVALALRLGEHLSMRLQANN